MLLVFLSAEFKKKIVCQANVKTFIETECQLDTMA